MKRLFASVLAAVCLLAGCAAPAEETAPAPEGGFLSVTAEEAARRMDEEPDCVILDVRTREEYEQAHIPGAICIPNETIGEEAPPELPDRQQLILVYCRSGRRSKQAAEKLAALGYTRVVEFGGILDWPGETVSGSGA